MNDMVDGGQMLTQCPVCLGNKLEQEYIISKAGFMSRPGYSHSRCCKCGSVLLDPQPTEEQLNEFYKSQAVEKDVEREIAYNSLSRIFDAEKYSYFYQNRIKPLQGFIKQDATIFDVGCGVGAFVKAMKELGYSITGNDLSKVSLKIGRENYELSEDELIYGDMYSLADSKYNCITLWTVIEHLLHPDEYLQYIHDHLEDNGILLLEFPTVDSLMFEHFREDFFWVMPPYHIYLYSIQGMKQMLERTGFELLLEYRMPKNWYFFDVLARKCNMDNKLVSRIKENSPEFSILLDTLLDDIALQQGKSSSVQLIVKKI